MNTAEAYDQLVLAKEEITAGDLDTAEKMIDEALRNLDTPTGKGMVFTDQFISEAIKLGKLVGFDIEIDDGLEPEKRVLARCDMIDAKNENKAVHFIGTGPTLGHALEVCRDKMRAHFQNEPIDDAEALAAAASRMDPNHAMLVGNVLGALNEMPDASDVRPEADAQGNYTNRIYVTRKSGEYVVTVEKVGR